jgi:uncharacterized repeat protein (TIGR01451 family)
MRPNWLCCALWLGLATAEVAQAQFPFQPMPPLPPTPGPLMYLRLTGPKGAKITVYRGFDNGQTLELPCTLGFRPGYSYRFAVFDIPALPRQIFCPSLEVRGALALSLKMRNSDFPAHINFTEEEFSKVILGTYVKKIVTLERPDRAIPIATKADEPLEIPVLSPRDPLIEAAERGQPLVVYQLGQRFLTTLELAAQAIPGTVLLPADKLLGAPRLPPYLKWSWCPVYDPLHGPRPPAEFVTLYDGGDSGPSAGFDRFGKLRGLDPTDTVAEYMDSKGTKKLAVSSRVGLCVPRFLIFKTEFSLATQAARLSVNSALATAAPSASVGQVSLKGQLQQQQPESIGSGMRLSGTFNTLGTSVAGRIQGLQIKSNLRSAESVDVVAAGTKQVEPEDGPLVIIKWPDKSCVNVGEIVTFYLKYSNTGAQPITNVVVSDSLGARFEYVNGSTKTDRDALFTTQANEVGSTVLRWEFTGALQAREHGLVTFQVRVR